MNMLAPAISEITRQSSGSVTTPYGSVLFWMVGPGGFNGSASVPGLADYIYVQAPWSPPGFTNPVLAWGEVRQLGEDGLLLSAPAALLVAVLLLHTVLS